MYKYRFKRERLSDMRKIPNTMSYLFKQTNGNKILVKHSTKYNYISYKKQNKKGKNILLVRVEQRDCFLFDGFGHLIDDDTLVTVKTGLGEFNGMAKVTKCGLTLLAKNTKYTFVYSDILYLEALKYVHNGYVESIGDGTRKYYY